MGAKTHHKVTTSLTIFKTLSVLEQSSQRGKEEEKKQREVLDRITFII